MVAMVISELIIIISQLLDLRFFQKPDLGLLHRKIGTST